MFFSVIAKNSNWQILTKNQFLLNDGMAEFTEKSEFKRSGMKNQHVGGELPKDGHLNSLKIQQGALQKRGRDVFERV